MKINIPFPRTYIYVAAVLMLFLPHGAQAQGAGGLNGLYCHKATIEMTAPAERDGVCPPQTEKVAGLNACRATKKNSQVLHARENADGTLDIGVSVWQDGFNCGVAGKAQKTDKGWHLEKFVNDPDAYARCRIDITVVRDVLTLRTDPKAACRYACGAGIGLDGVQFPLGKSRVGPAREDVFTSEEAVYTKVLCP
jgi:hypothetical protein